MTPTGAKPDAVRLTDRRMRRLAAVAYREAGHAVVAFLNGEKLRHVTIKSTEDYLGQVLVYQFNKRFTPDAYDPRYETRYRRRIENAVLTLLAGLYCRDPEGLRSQLIRHSQLLLGRMERDKKRFGKVYDYRSSFLHGGLDIPFAHREVHSPDDAVWQFIWDSDARPVWRSRRS